MVYKLTPKHLEEKKAFIKRYMGSLNAASASAVDANANVVSKNIATLEAEINKDVNIQVNRSIMTDKITVMYGQELADEYIRQIESHEIYPHDETSLKPYCVSVSMFELLRNGMTTLGGESKAPNNIYSFAGSFVNMVFAVASQFAGAVATVEFLMYFDHFARKEFGEGYTKNLTPKVRKDISQLFQHVVYSINQPAAARGYQSVFWNISVYDEHYFNSLFGEFVFPDGDKPKWDSIDGLQKLFMKWFNAEREKALLTFPVVTVAMLTKDKAPKDKDFEDFIAEEMSEGNAFFVYQSDSADSLASCCRLRNEISDNTFSYSLGAGGVSTGSINVITINFNRLIQDGRDLAEEIDKIHMYQLAYRAIMDDYKAARMLPVYDAGYISLDKQFLTIGINGMVEAAEFLGMTASNNEEYKSWVSGQLKIIYDANKAIKKSSGKMFNTEFVPAENLGVKNAKWDKADGYKVPRDCYNSYFYVVEDNNEEELSTSLDKFILQGDSMTKYLDGGSALHLNLEEYLTKDNAKNILRIAAKTGCNYFCTNIKVTICEECGYINKNTEQYCTKCGSKDICHGTRVIGYLKKETSFSKARQIESADRHYHKS